MFPDGEKRGKRNFFYNEGGEERGGRFVHPISLNKKKKKGKGGGEKAKPYDTVLNITPARGIEEGGKRGERGKEKPLI